MSKVNTSNLKSLLRAGVDDKQDWPSSRLLAATLVNEREANSLSSRLEVINRAYDTLDPDHGLVSNDLSTDHLIGLIGLMADKAKYLANREEIFQITIKQIGIDLKDADTEIADLEQQKRVLEDRVSEIDSQRIAERQANLTANEEIVQLRYQIVNQGAVQVPTSVDELDEIRSLNNTINELRLKLRAAEVGEPGTAATVSDPDPDDNVVHFQFEHPRCEACGSHRVGSGGTKRMGHRTINGKEYEVLEGSRIETTCEQCGYVKTVISSPTEKSIQAFIEFGNDPLPPIVIQPGDTVWEGIVKSGTVFEVLAKPNDVETFGVKIVAKESK